MVVFSLHEHVLRPGADVRRYEQDITSALENLTRTILGLRNAWLLKGVKGERGGGHAVLWEWDSEQAIHENFGTPDNPRWPQAWLHYENVLLAPYLTVHPDAIVYTDYVSVPIALMPITPVGRAPSLS